MKKIKSLLAKSTVIVLLVSLAYAVPPSFADAVCGNSQMENGEQCDDGNTDAGDGCSATCQLEPMTGGVTNVVGADTDDISFGLNGDDFLITWTPGQSAPAGYTGTMVYVVPNALAVDSTDVMTNACGGGACEPVGFFMQYPQSSHLLPPFMNKDSAGTNWDAATAYKACVYTQAAVSTLDCSDSFNVVSDDDVEDTMAPFIMHMSTYSYITGQEMTLYASIFDDQTTDADFQAGTDGAAVEMFHDGTTPGTVTDAGQVTKVAGTGNLWKFETNTALDRAMKYYLKVTDKAGNIRYFTADPAIDMAENPTEAQAAGAAFTVLPLSAGANALSGTVYDGSTGNAIADSAYVFLNGLAIPGVTTSSGAYSFSNLPNGAYDVVATKSGYCEQMRFENITGNRTGVDLWLNLGECNMMMGGPGDMGGGGKPHPMFSSPPDSMNNSPLDEPILVGFDQQLNSSTINDSDATGAGDNVYLTTDDGTTKVAGSVMYCPDKNAAGCSALHDFDTNVIMFMSSQNLTENTFYSLVITGAVTSETGMSIDGNRPGGGHELSFSTGGAAFTDFNTDIGNNFGTGGMYMPPFVESVSPGPGMIAAPNAKLIVTFNDAMDSATISTDTIKLMKGAQEQTVTVSLDTPKKVVTITPSSSLAAGGYEIQVMGAVANSTGVPMRAIVNAGEVAFSSFFEVSGGVDNSGPVVYPMITNNSTDVPVNTGSIEFGFSEPLDPGTVTESNITFKRGSTSVSIDLDYDLGMNRLFIIPDNILAPNTKYTVTFTANVKDLAGVAADLQSFSFTTGNADTVRPGIREARCDDYTCKIFFTEPMNNDRQTGSDWTNSVLNNSNWTIERVSPDNAVIDISGKPIMYHGDDFSVVIEGVSGFSAGNEFRVTAGAQIQDLAGNAILTDSGENIFRGPVENSADTYGSFDDGGMFGPPMGGTVGGEFKMDQMGGFGEFTAEEFMFGDAVNTYPFNNIAGMDVNVFQINIPMSKVGIAPQDGDIIVVTFPNGTNITNTKQDEYSPFLNDFNMGEPGTITFDSTYDTDGILVDTTSRTVKIKLDITGTPTVNDHITIDIRGIINPSIPKGPDSGGYTTGIKWMRGDTVKANLTSMPYFISGGGSNTITVKVYAGSTAGIAGADGNLFMYGGGPAGPMDKGITLTDGKTTTADGTPIVGDTGIVYSNIPDGCYNFGTEPFVTLGGNDYFGQSFPEPVCVHGGETKSRNIILSAASGASSVPVTVKISHSGGGFGGADIDIFAGGPNRFVVKTITNVDVPDANGYTINLPANGFWNLGIGPAAPKGPSAGPPDFEAFGAMPPSPIDLEVRGLPGSGSVKAGFNTPHNVSFSDITDTVTFTVASSSIQIPVQVTDGTNPLKNADVFMHQLGFGGGAFGITDSNGQVTLKIADYGPYEIGTFVPGLGDTFKQIDVRNENGTKIYVDGSLVDTVTLKLLKADYTISGKVLDANGEAISYAPVWAENANGRFIPGGTGGDGSYTLFVPAGTWTLYSELPPSATEVCGTFQKTVVITNASKSNQNITSTNSTCYTVSGTVTIGGSLQANNFVFVESWDTANDRPAGGFHRGVSTDSTGAYSAKVPAGTYRIGTFHPDFGELSSTTTVSGNKSVNLNSGTLADITFTFTGGSADMNGFIEVKKADDRHVRFGKPFNGSDENIVLSVKEGTYEYMVDLFGVGNFKGSVTTGSTATIDLSANTMVTFSGTIHDASGNVMPNATVSLHDFENDVHRFTQTDSNGDYSIQIKSGEYDVDVKRVGYVAPGATVTLTENTADYDFGGNDGSEQSGLTQASKTIEGTIYQSDGSTPETDGFVWAQDSSGNIVSAPVDPVDGSYKLNVTPNAQWTVSGAAPLHDETEYSSDVNTTDAIADTGVNITLTANTEKVPKSKNSSINIATGGTVDDTDNTGMRLVAAGGVLDTGQGTASVTMEKSYKAPATDNFKPLDQASFDLNVTDSSDQMIKDFAGNVELTFDFDPSDIPSGVEESNLSVMYYSNEANAYKECEGGVTVDETNNTVTCVVGHATTFAITYPSSLVASVAPQGGSKHAPEETVEVVTAPGGGGGGGGGGSSVMIAKAKLSGPSYSNTETSDTPVTISESVAKVEMISAPVMLKQSLMIASGSEKTINLTQKEGSIILKPNKNATVSAIIPSETKVTGGIYWDGRIEPPLIKSTDIINEEGGCIEGSSLKLKRSEVAVVVHVGSEESVLKFSKTVDLKVPVDLPDNTGLKVYYSQDGINWKVFNEGAVYKVQNDEVAIKTDHFTYFAFEVVETAEEEVEEAELFSAPKFTDIKGHWAEDYINEIAGKGIVSGKRTGIFAPNDNITRAELTKIAVNSFELEATEEASGITFKDVQESAWYSSFVRVAKFHKLVQGYSDGRFKPDDYITRAEALKIMLTAAGFTLKENDSVYFKDTERSAWYMKYLAYAVRNAIVNGYNDGTFRPGANINRAETAKIIVKILEMKESAEE